MSATVELSDDLKHLDRAVQAAFEVAQDEIAEVIAKNWKGEIVRLDVIDTGNYLEAVRVTGMEEAAGPSRIVTISAPEAESYAAVIKRGHAGNYDYVGLRVAEQGIEQSQSQIDAALDKAGQRIA